MGWLKGNYVAGYLYYRVADYMLDAQSRIRAVNAAVSRGVILEDNRSEINGATRRIN